MMREYTGEVVRQQDSVKNRRRARGPIAVAAGQATVRNAPIDYASMSDDEYQNTKRDEWIAAHPDWKRRQDELRKGTGDKKAILDPLIIFKR